MPKPKARPKSVKGSLIKGMSGRLPRDILSSILFRQRLREVMRGYAGVYALYRKDDLYYVGLSSNLLGRITHHTKDRHADRWDHFRVFRIQKVRYLRDVEILMQGLVDAPGNRVRGKVPRDADINRILREVLTEHKYTIRDIERALTK